MLPIVYVGDISIALSTVVLTISMAIAAVLAVFIHESIHYFGYRLSGSEPEFKRSGFNPYVTNFDHAITLWNKLWIDALPTIVGIVFILIFVLINQFYTIPVVLNYSIATVLIWLVALARMDWRNIYQLDNKVENTKEYTIIHRKKAQNEYPIGIIEKR